MTKLRKLLGLSLVWCGMGSVAALAATINVPGDQPTIRAAIAAASAGDVVHVEIGTYQERIDIPPGLDGLTLEGDLSGETILEGTPGTSNDIIRIRSHGVRVQDFTMRGGNTAIRVDYATGVWLEFITMQGPREGIRVTNGGYAFIGAVVIDGTTGGAGIRITNSPGSLVYGVWVIQARREGIRVQNSADAILYFSTVEFARGGDGVRVVSSPNAQVDLNTVYSSYANGIRIQSSPGVFVQNNQADFNRDYGIRVESSPPVLSVVDLQNAGNTGTDNGKGEFRVLP